MVRREDTELVDILYGEQPEVEDHAAELAELQATLTTLRRLEAEVDDEPAPHLDALILAQARAEAGRLEAEASGRGLGGWFRKLLGQPLLGLATAGSVAAVLAVVLVPTVMRTEAPERVVPSSVESRAAAAPSAVPTEGALAEARPEPEASSEDEDPGPAFAVGDARDESLRGGLGRRRAPTRRRAPATEVPADALAGPGRTAAAQPAPQKVAQASAPREEAERRADLGELAARAAAGAGAPGESSALELARETAKKGASTAAPPPPTAAAPAAPPPAMPRTDSAAPAPRAEPRPAEPRAQAAERRPRASAEALELDDAVDQAQREAVALMRQAETSRARGEIEVARRLLAAARAKVMGQPLEGEVLLRAAELELSASAHDQAEAFARAALSVRGFTGRAAAEALLERIRQARGR